MDSDTLQEMIHINLTLLYNKGHVIDFKEGMFQERNLPGFEKVAYALALVINPKEAKKNIPWPLLEDKKLRNEFRLKFCKFIKTVNTEHDAKIPELSASNLQYPGGLMFLNFMYKLSTFAMELELKRMMSPVEAEEMLERYETNQRKSEDLEVYAHVCLGHRYAEESKMREHAEYQEEASSAINELEESSKFLEDMMKSTQAKLQSQVTDLAVYEDMKNRLFDVSCNEVMEDWNGRTEVKLEELRRANERLCRVSEVTSSVTDMILKTAGNQKEGTCLDGSKLKITHSVAKFANAPVRSSSGDVKLERLFAAALAALQGLGSSAPTEPSQLPCAQDLRTEDLAQSRRLRKCCEALNQLETTCAAEIAEIRPVLYESVRGRERPEWFACLRSLPLIPLVLASEKNLSTNRRVRKSVLSRVMKSELYKKKKKTVLTSFKLKRPFLHPLMTPSLQRKPKTCSTASRAAPEPSACSTAVRATHGPPPPVTSAISRANPSTKSGRPSLSTVYRPSCKKSLYGKLPTGSKPIEDDSIDLLDEPDFPPMAMISEGVVENIDPSITVSSRKPVEKLTQEKTKRRSIDLIIERYRQLKNKTNESVTESQFSKSELILE